MFISEGEAGDILGGLPPLESGAGSALSRLAAYEEQYGGRLPPDEPVQYDGGSARSNPCGRRSRHCH